MEREDRDLRLILRDFSRALTGAIAESPELERTLRRLRNEGYSLQLTVGCARLAPALEPVAATSSASEPSFRIDMQDLSFLKSIGIDPTRRLRRRRS
jgi:hypothetical protein